MISYPTIVIIFAITLLATALVTVIFFLRKIIRANAVLVNRNYDLEKSDKIKDQLFAIIGHDLIGNIGTIPIALEICRDTKTTELERSYLLEQIENNAVASFATLQSLLNWGRYQLQGVVIKQECVNVQEASKEALDLIGIPAKKKKITIVNNIPVDIVVLVDPNHFNFVFRNLLSNAVKYTKTSGYITLNAERSTDGSHIVFSVKDDGIGLSEEKKAEIFESFGISTPGTEFEKGNGIGLRLCKEFVEENGGTIWVESQINKGTIFYFSVKNAKK